MNQYPIQQQEILEFLQNVYNTNIEDQVPLNQGIGNADSPGPDGDTVPCADPNNHDQAGQEESDMDLPTPPYVPLQQHGTSRPDVSNQVQTD